MSAAEITILTKDGGPLTKRIALREDGTLSADGAACVMASGRAQRMQVTDVAQFATVIKKLKPEQAIALGRLRPGLPDAVAVTTKDKLNGGAGSGVIARTAGNLVYAKERPAFALLDFDRKGLPPELAADLETRGGMWNALEAVLPALKNVSRVTRASTSAGLRRADTGESLPASGGLHVYVAVQDGEDVPRFLKALHDRAWLAGFGWLMVGAGGQLLERSIVDRMVGAPERLVFEGGPILTPPLEQDRESRRPIAIDGVALDTARACPPLTIAEQARLRELRAKAEHQLAPDAAKARSDFITKQAERLAERRGLSLPAAKEIVTRQCDGILLPDVELPFDDPALAGCTVADVLADPERFEGETLADPLEGADYGRGKAKIMRRRDGSPWINSFAHGHTVYELKLGASSLREAITQADGKDAAAIFIKLAVQADLREDETETLRDLAADRAGIGRRTVTRMLKQAQAKQATEQRTERRKRRLAERSDPRPLIDVPEPDAPWLPVMDTLNEALHEPTTAKPQSRDIDDDVAAATRFAFPATHAFNQANPQETNDD
jgi:hypothetical protein